MREADRQVADRLLWSAGWVGGADRQAAVAEQEGGGWGCLSNQEDSKNI